MADTETKWFLNEEGEAYDYDPAKQAEDFPNDFPTAYDTKEEAEAVIEEIQKGFVDPADIPLARCNVSFMTSVTMEHAGSLAEAAEIAALNIIRFGLDDYYILYTDPDTDRQWISHGNNFSEVQRNEETADGASD